MTREWAELCNAYVGALFSYTHSADLCMITRVRETDGVLEFIYHKMQTNGEHAVSCRFFFDKNDVVWYRAPNVSAATKKKFYLQNVKNFDDSRVSINVK